MNANQYQTECLRTLSGMNDNHLLHGAIGIATEGGELLDALKKNMFYGRELDHMNLIEELGDIMWYVAVAAHALEVDLETVMAGNIAKLRARYPEKWTADDAENRDVESEMIALRGSL